MAKKLRINEYIRVPTVRLIDENEAQVGIVALEKALEMAMAAELDLVEVSPNVHPSVCKIMDFGKYLYAQKKAEKKHKVQQKQTEVKGVRLTLRIGEHDMETKANHARRFLAQRNLVKVTLQLRGRENAHTDLAREKLNTFSASLVDVAKVEEYPKKSGNMLTMMLSPNK